VSAEQLLSRCEKVRATGNGNWIARCPAHDDKTPSMTVREVNDGRILVHCFAGCSVDEIVGAVGLELDALFPPKCVGAAAVKAFRKPFPAESVLEALSDELLVASIIASDMHKKREISEQDYKRLWLAFERISEARKLSGG
jgi:hypothetical protein